MIFVVFVMGIYSIRTEQADCGGNRTYLDRPDCAIQLAEHCANISKVLGSIDSCQVQLVLARCGYNPSVAPLHFNHIILTHE